MSPTIEQIKDLHEDHLIKIEGVEGVGIGVEDGKKVILVYISSDKAISRIPKEIEGFFVKCERSGKVTAF